MGNFYIAGHYIYVQNSQNPVGDTTLLQSSIYFASSPACQMTFWYNSFGSPGIVLKVLLKTRQQAFVQLISNTTDSSTVWKRMQFNVGAFNSFAFIIEVAFPRNTPGKIVAIDDISFSKCAPGMLAFYWYFLINYSEYFIIV